MGITITLRFDVHQWVRVIETGDIGEVVAIYPAQVASVIVRIPGEYGHPYYPNELELVEGILPFDDAP